MSQQGESDRKGSINPNWFLIVVAVIGLGYGYWVFQNQTASADPHWQQYVETENMPAHRVNLWSDPYPPRTDEVRFTVQFDFVEFMDSEVDSAGLQLIAPTGKRSKHVLEPVQSPKGGVVYRTTPTLEMSGNWKLQVEMNYRGYTHTSEFDLVVQDQREMNEE